MRFLPLAGMLLLFAIAFCWRSWLQFRRHGTWGIVAFQGGWRQRLRDGLALVAFALLTAQAVAAARSPETLSPLVSASTATAGILQVAGAGLLLAGLIALVKAQLHLGASWRIGIEETARPGLVTEGLYRFSRNPIFLALLTILAGYALMLPTVLSLALLAGGYIGVRQQTIAEEAYLLRAYGDSYRDYARRVGRFIPGIGRLR